MQNVVCVTTEVLLEFFLNNIDGSIKFSSTEGNKTESRTELIGSRRKWP